MRRLVVDIEERHFEKFHAWTGPNSYGWTLEKMIQREERRQKKREEKANALTKSISLVNPVS